MNPIEQRLRREIGLDAASVGASLVERTIRLRMKAHGLQELNQYQELLASSRPEWEELIEAVIVTETWFFREPEAFSALVQLVQPALSLESRVTSPKARLPTPDFRPACVAVAAETSAASKNTPARRRPETQDARLQTPDFSAPVRILSVPCATGEEPYSLAMALLDAGVPPARFTIDAVDLSARALARAQVAIYGQNSFRGPALAPCGSGGTGGAGSGPPDHMGRAYRDRHFAAAGAGFKLHDRFRECVTFQRGNLLAEKFSARRSPYDIIFCRNLLIYFDRGTQTRALQKLHHLLAPRGVLFVGPAELPLVSEHGFAPAGFPMAFACRKAGNESPSHPPRRGFLRRPVSTAPPPARPPPVTIVIPEPEPPPPASRRAVEVTRTLNQARALADAGRLAEAIALCEAHLKTEGPSAQAYYLIGLARDADGDPAAMDYYRKALYLEPNHYDTLLQMSLLLEKNGDAKGARTFKRRAERQRVRTEARAARTET